eukprot:TRINITY_DN3467_c0_g1_i1.p1 TRINITY_DN3467_c0_g1~~TRINITY_DN3467_c0_g1_i1.p1  ORF type:complete len:502 (-),score=72.44 TRINITY_DN3467_c0_g1_i1:96-1502(-)
MQMIKAQLEKECIITPDVSQQIFLNVDALYQINKGLASDLTNSTKSIGEVYLGLAPFLKLYAFYCENHDSALEVVAKLKKKKKEFAAFDEELSKEYNGLYIKDFLIKPVQRICKYPLLFRSLIECIPEDTDYWKVIDTLKGKINDIVRDINSLKDNAENFSAINHYVQSLVDYPGNLLDSLERKFIREESCQWINVKKSDVSRLKKEDAPERTILVFNDKIILCKAKKSAYLYKGEITFANMRLVPLEVDHKYFSTAFFLDSGSPSTADRTNALFFEKPTSKDFWFKTLKKLAVEAKVKMATTAKSARPGSGSPVMLSHSTSQSLLQINRESPRSTIESSEDLIKPEKVDEVVTDTTPSSPTAGDRPSHVSFVRSRQFGSISSPKGRSSSLSLLSFPPTPSVPGATPIVPLSSKKSFRRARCMADYSSMAREELEEWCTQLQEENSILSARLRAAEQQLASYTDENLQ